VDRFYIGDIGLGIGKLLTLGGLGIWAIVDWFLIRDAAEVKNVDIISDVKRSILAARPRGS
jgi:TM2 domain-containing membrane protein YozV